MKDVQSSGWDSLKDRPEFAKVKSVSNVLTGKTQTPDGDKDVLYARPVVDIASEIYDANDDWPRVVGGQIFVEQTRASRIGGYTTRLLKDHDDLFTWLHERTLVRWASPRGTATDKLTGRARSCVTRPEMHRHIRETRTLRYTLVAEIPHHPPIEGVHYLPCDLPPPTGERLKEFIDHLNPETENDRLLMLAALLTTIWGGPPGARPMFCFTAATKQGSGKTATAYAIADVVGGVFAMDPRSKWADNAKSMMSSDQWGARVILWDNVKGRFGGESIEAAITSPTINGWKSYVGSISRLNDATHFVTLNDPELSSDLALRSVEIRVGRPKHGVRFISWARAFVAEHRLQIIADCIAMLQGEQQCEVATNDRFGEWQHAVLSRIPGGGDLSDWIVERRGSLDADSKLGDDLSDALQAVLMNEGRVGGEVTSDDLYNAAVGSGVWKDDQARGVAENRRKAVRMVTQILGGHGLCAVATPSGGPLRKRVYGEENKSRLVTLYTWNPPAQNDDEIDLGIPV